jgi:hypothetical protein
MFNNHWNFKQNRNDYVPERNKYTLRHTASMFSCYVSPEEKKEEQETKQKDNNPKENKSKNMLKRLFGF